VISHWPPKTDFVSSCVEAILSNVGAEGDRCARAAAEYICRKRAGEATPLDKIAVKHGASFSAPTSGTAGCINRASDIRGTASSNCWRP